MRAIAVLAVIAAHIALYQVAGATHLAGGFVGVDVFFVLSGFLITSLLLREADRTGRVSIVGFYARRARRILPAATLVLVAVVLYAAWRLPEVERAQFSTDARWSAAFLANYHFASIGTNYFDTNALSPLQHFWSLAVEEQFYLIWPLLIWLLAPRLRRTWLAGIVGLLCFVSLGWSVYITSWNGSISTHEAYFSSPARAYELGIGAFIAILPINVRGARWRIFLGISALLTIAGCVYLLPADAAFPGWEALIPCLATATLIVCGRGGDTMVSKVLSLRPLTFVGDISYSAYLWHFPVIVFARSLFPTGWSLQVLIPAELVTVLLLSVASYYVIEQPIHRRRIPVLRIGDRALVLWPLALGLVFGCIELGAAHAHHEQVLKEQAAARWYAQHRNAIRPVKPQPDDPSAAVAAELAQAVSLANQGAPFPPNLSLHQIMVGQPGPGYYCFAADGYLRPPRQSCTYGDRSASWVVALMGDSHAGMLIPFLDRLGKRNHFRVVMYQKLGCAPYAIEQGSGLVQSQCDNFKAWAMDQLRLLRPNVAVLYARGFLDPTPTSKQSVASQWQAGEISTVRWFKNLGTRVVLVGDVPRHMEQPAACIQGSAKEKDCMIAPVTPESQSNVVTEAVARMEQIAYMPMQQFVCWHGQCPLVVGSRIVYWDESHLSRAWIDHISSALAEKFLPLLEPSKHVNGSG